jgi:hypothetical protein
MILTRTTAESVGVQWRTVQELELMDIHLHGRMYTWSNERENPTLVRLDRVLVTLDWEERYTACHCHLQAARH